ncbi:MAG: hypothetical protein FWE03_03040 [Firmicutes bacterium]|nr:hypothetical protein [Bacillota bacterium]
MKKLIIFGAIFILSLSSIFMFSACRRYEDAAGIFHAHPSGRPDLTLVLDLRANGNFSLSRLNERGTIDSTFEGASSGRFSVTEDNRIILTFDDGHTRTGRITDAGNIDLAVQSIYGASIFRRQ